MPPPLKYRGVFFISTGGRKPWRAQIQRRRIGLVLGSYATPEEAAHVADNASYYLREWAKAEPLYNFPLEVKNSSPSAHALRAEAKLQKLYPNWISEQTADKAKTETERVKRDGFISAESIIQHVATLRQSLLWALGQVQQQEVEIFQLKEEVAVGKRVAAGLRATGGHNPFHPVPRRPKAVVGDIVVGNPFPPVPPYAPVVVSDQLGS